jgi:hypothetical protein
MSTINFVADSSRTAWYHRGRLVLSKMSLSARPKRLSRGKDAPLWAKPMEQCWCSQVRNNSSGEGAGDSTLLGVAVVIVLASSRVATHSRLVHGYVSNVVMERIVALIVVAQVVESQDTTSGDQHRIDF